MLVMQNLDPQITIRTDAACQSLCYKPNAKHPADDWEHGGDALMVMRTDVHETRSKSSDGGQYVHAVVSFDVENLSRCEYFMLTISSDQGLSDGTLELPD